MFDRRAGLIVALILVAAITTLVARRPHSPATLTTTTLTTMPATTATSAPAVVIASPATLLDVLRLDNPSLPTTQPLAVPLDDRDAYRLPVDRPMLIDSLGHLWTQDAGATPLNDVLMELQRKGIGDRDTFVVRDLPDCVMWVTVHGKLEAVALLQEPAGASAATQNSDATTRIGADPATFVITPAGRKLLRARAYLPRAMLLPDGIVLPDAAGVSVITFDRGVQEARWSATAMNADPLAAPQAAFAARGVIAWSPATAKSPGGTAAWYRDGKWTALDATAWPSSIVQLTPFLDGTVRQLRLNEDGTTTILNVALDTPGIDADRVRELIAQLDDLSQKRRNAASDALAQIGPSAWPILQGVGENASPEAQQRIAAILGGTAEHPSIGAMTPIDGKLRVVRRFDDGGVLLFDSGGVTVPQPGEPEPASIIPAWIALRPGHAAELLPGQLVADQRPDAPTLQPCGDDWIIADAANGPQRFIGNGLQPLFRKSERPFSQYIATDWRGRSLWRQPGHGSPNSPTLLIDPTIPDPTPRLPAWTIKVDIGGDTGWTQDGWPAIKRGGTWALHESGWLALDEAPSSLQVTPAEIESPLSSTTQPSLLTTAATTSPTTEPALATDLAGDRYFGGNDSITIVRANGQRIECPLPDTAVGQATPTLLVPSPGKLFLYNEPGRIVGLTLDGDALKLFAIFSRGIPPDAPRRVWLDPAGRICIAGEQTMTIAFPDGRLPDAIEKLMSPDDLKDALPE